VFQYGLAGTGFRGVCSLCVSAHVGYYPKANCSPVSDMFTFRQASADLRDLLWRPIAVRIEAVKS
jgi:hypothetical protein